MVTRKLWWVVAVVLLIVGCNSHNEGDMRERLKQVHQCPVDSATQRAEFILRCIENANPKSDEEPEDWIGMCEDMAENTYCPLSEKVVTQQYDGFRWHTVATKLAGGE